MLKRLLDRLGGSALGELFLYLIVGGLATIVEWASFWLFCNGMGVQYLVATALAFAISTLANWLFGRLLVFRKASGQSLAKEIGSVYLASVVGLLLNLAIMFVLVQRMSTDEMLAKMAATVLVFAYNYLIRKFLIYKKR